MKSSLIILLFSVFCFAQNSTGYIDMHGGKSDSLMNQNSGFSNKSMVQSPFSKTIIEKKKTEKKMTKIIKTKKGIEEK